MLTGIRHTAVLVLGCLLLTVVMACGSAAEPSLDKAQAALQLGQYESAIENFNETIRLDPQYAKAHYLRGSAYYTIGRTDNDYGKYQWAIEDFDEAIRLDPQYADAYNDRGIAHHLLGADERASVP